MRIKLTKIGIPQNAAYPSETDKSKVAEELGDKSPWVDYEVIGHIDEIPQVGETLHMARSHRNGVEIGGYFRSSRIEEVSKNIYKWTGVDYDLITQNSIYKLEIL